MIVINIGCEVCGKHMPHQQAHQAVDICDTCRKSTEEVPVWICVLRSKDRTWVEISTDDDHGDIRDDSKHIIHTKQAYLPANQYALYRDTTATRAMTDPVAILIRKIVPTMVTTALRPDLTREPRNSVDALFEHFSSREPALSPLEVDLSSKKKL